jgi:hypothetical protein
MTLDERFKERASQAIKEMETLGYVPKILLRMIGDCGVIEAVRRVVNEPNPSGFRHLQKLNALHLSMESIILEDEWKDLFSEHDRQCALKKLQSCGL